LSAITPVLEVREVRETPLLSAKKLPALDGVRGLAILAVMMHHSFWLIRSSAPPLVFAKWILSLGWAGVDLFFVLSGFLITGILIDTRPAANYFQSFYARRALRIFPLYAVFLGVGLLVFPLIVAFDWLPLPSDRWLYFCYLTNWLALWQGPWRHSVLAHLWSLAVEEQFYLFWPLLVWLVRPGFLLRTLIGVECAVVIGRGWWVLQHGPSQAVALATVTRMDGLIIGAICALLIRRYRAPVTITRRLPWIAAGGLYLYAALALRFARPEAFDQYAGIPLLALCFGLIVLYAVLTDGENTRIQRALNFAPLGRVGKYAYAMYLFHVPILHFEDTLIDRFVPLEVRSSLAFGCLAVAGLIAITYYLAKLSYRYFESRFLQWKGRFAAIQA
jgi:peptidoglycan/LPS O-acetylase OafA/YrhL